jgi:biotin synthase
MDDTLAEKNTDALMEMSLDELLAKANGVRKTYVGKELQLCSILNARSGLCSEDCKFCAQAGTHRTDAEVYALKPKEEIVAAAREAAKIGASRFGIVTSGNQLSPQEIETVVAATTEIAQELGLGICGSLGALSKAQLEQLKQAGMTRFHHNIETSERFYPKIVTTHSYQQRIDTIRSAKEVGLSVCSGGIIGMGETWEDRVDMAITLKELDVDSVPINILVPMAGTPMESVARLSAEDAIRTICLFRIILKDTIIKIAAGREPCLGDQQIRGFQAGANGMIIGGYLTTPGDELAKDHRLIEAIRQLWNE